MNPQGALNFARNVACQCIPELHERPLYLVQPAADSKVARYVTDRRLGMYCRGLDSALRSQLEAEGRWQGPGVGIIVDAEACYAVAGNDDNGMRRVVGVTLHELAHWLDDPEPAAAERTTYHELLAAIDKHQRREAKPTRIPPAFVGHGESFIRLCCHLWYRAGHGGGIVLPPRYLAFGNDYPSLEMLDSPLAYIDALGDELHVYLGLPLRGVATLPQPEQFTMLWDATLMQMFPTTAAVPLAEEPDGL